MSIFTSYSAICIILIHNFIWIIAWNNTSICLISFLIRWFTPFSHRFWISMYIWLQKPPRLNLKCLIINNKTIQTLSHTNELPFEEMSFFIICFTDSTWYLLLVIELPFKHRVHSLDLAWSPIICYRVWIYFKISMVY